MFQSVASAASPGHVRTRQAGIAIRSMAAMLCLLIGSVGVLAQEVRAGQVVGASRSAQASVLFGNRSATVTDVVDRVVFHRSTDGLILENASFYRRPYRLSDGMLYVQTPPFESDLFVRQVIENPLASRTLILFPESDLGKSQWAARLRALRDVSRLNPERALVVLMDGSDEVETRRSIEQLEASRARLDDQGLMSLLLASIDGNSAMDASLGLFAATDRVSLAPAVVEALPRALANDPALAAEMADLRELYIDSAQGFIDEMLFGQLLLTVETVERAIRVAITEDLTDNDLRRVNELQGELARTLAWGDIRTLVENPDHREVVAVLRAIDNLIGSDSLAVFQDGMDRINELITTEFAAAVDPVLESYARRFCDPSEEELRRERVRAVRQAMSQLEAGSIAILETGDGDLYEHVEWCMRDGSYNLIAFSDLTATDVAGLNGIPDADRLDSIIDSAPPLHEQGVFVHPLLRSPAWAEGEELTRVLILERVRLEYEIDSASDSEIVVNYIELSGAAGIVSVLRGAGAVGQVISQYVIPGDSFLTQLRSVRDLDSSDGLSDDELEILQRWVLVARTAFDI